MIYTCRQLQKVSVCCFHLHIHWFRGRLCRFVPNSAHKQLQYTEMNLKYLLLFQQICFVILFIYFDNFFMVDGTVAFFIIIMVLVFVKKIFITDSVKSSKVIVFMRSMYFIYNSNIKLSLQLLISILNAFATRKSTLHNISL